MSPPSTTQKMHELAGLLLDREDAAVSPLSIELCLAMLLAGAAVDTHDAPDAPDADAPAPDADAPQPSTSDTHRQLCAALGLDPAHEHHFLDTCKQKRAELTAEIANVQVGMASALFCAAGIKDAYTALCAERLDAQVLPLASSAGINAWVAERTKGMIAKVLTEDPPGPLVLVQTLVFDAKFTYRFDPEKTRPAMFDRRGHVPGRNWPDQSCATDPVEVQMMTMTANLRYTANNAVQVVELPYGKLEDGSPFVAYVFLPQGTSDLRKTVRTLIFDHQAFEEVVACLDDTDLQLSLPKFSIDCSASIVDALKTMGVVAAFGAADFARMTDEPAFVQDVLHAVRIEVNEKGTKAAAATAAVIATRGTRQPRKDPVVMTVSSPFAFVVAHPATKTLLFAAVVSNPVA